MFLYLFNNLKNTRTRTEQQHISPSPSFIHKIIIKQVYPIFAALGSAVGLCTFFCTRQLTTSPGFTASKAKRATAIPETSQDVKEGEKFRNHFIRRTLSGRRPEIMPGLNSSMTKMN